MYKRGWTEATIREGGRRLLSERVDGGYYQRGRLLSERVDGGYYQRGWRLLSERETTIREGGRRLLSERVEATIREGGGRLLSERVDGGYYQRGWMEDTIREGGYYQRGWTEATMNCTHITVLNNSACYQSLTDAVLVVSVADLRETQPLPLVQLLLLEGGGRWSLCK